MKQRAKVKKCGYVAVVYGYTPRQKADTTRPSSNLCVNTCCGWDERLNTKQSLRIFAICSARKERGEIDPHYG